jgi:hypothetical protein
VKKRERPKGSLLLLHCVVVYNGTLFECHAFAWGVGVEERWDDACKNETRAHIPLRSLGQFLQTSKQGPGRADLGMDSKTLGMGLSGIVSNKVNIGQML